MELTEEEKKIIASVRFVRESGFGEVIVTVHAGRVTSVEKSVKELVNRS